MNENRQMNHSKIIEKNNEALNGSENIIGIPPLSDDRGIVLLQGATDSRPFNPG
jgi:hypothetical protein